jgi:hypothetical protein
VSEIAPRPDVAPGLRERKKQELRDRCSRPSRSLFDEKGFETTTVDEICARADVSQKTFFNYFRPSSTSCARSRSCSSTTSVR